MSNLTLVTAYFDLSALEKRGWLKSHQDYVNLSDFICSLDLNIVFFVERDIDLIVWEKRKKNNLLHKTLIIRKKYSELHFADQLENIAEYKKENPLSNEWVGKDTPLYYVLVWNKIFLVDYVMKKNPFSTTHFGWIDFGLYSVIKNDMPDNVIDIFANLPDKVRILEISTTFDSEIEDLKIYASKNRYKTGGGLWTGSKEYLQKLVKVFTEYLHICLSDRLFVSEESIMGILLNTNPELFDTFYGNYWQIVANFDKIRRPIDKIFNNLRECRKKECYGIACRIANKLYNDCYEKLSVLQKYILFDEWIISNYYIENKIDVLSLVKKILDNDEKLLELFQKNKTHIITNLRFYKNSEEIINIISRVVIKI